MSTGRLCAYQLHSLQIWGLEKAACQSEIYTLIDIMDKKKGALFASAKEGTFRGYGHRVLEREVFVGNGSPDPYIKNIVA